VILSETLCPPLIVGGIVILSILRTPGPALDWELFIVPDEFVAADEELPEELSIPFDGDCEAISPLVLEA
jgi:hypothetical protein